MQNSRLLRLRRKSLKKYGTDVELVTFNDYVLPNEALSKGDIDANAFQHKPYLDQQIKIAATNWLLSVTPSFTRLPVTQEN